MWIKGKRGRRRGGNKKRNRKKKRRKKKKRRGRKKKDLRTRRARRRNTRRTRHTVSHARMKSVEPRGETTHKHHQARMLSTARERTLISQSAGTLEKQNERMVQKWQLLYWILIEHESKNTRRGSGERERERERERRWTNRYRYTQTHAPMHARTYARKNLHTDTDKHKNTQTLKWQHNRWFETDLWKYCQIHTLSNNASKHLLDLQRTAATAD